MVLKRIDSDAVVWGRGGGKESIIYYHEESALLMRVVQKRSAYWANSDHRDW